MEDTDKFVYEEVDEDMSFEEPRLFKGGHTSLHATGFKDFLLRPELLQAIKDCGFEHPSEGIYQ